MHVLDTGTYLRVGFVNSQNLEYKIRMISIQNLDTNVNNKWCLEKIKIFYTFI